MNTDGLVEAMKDWLIMIDSEMPEGWHRTVEVRKAILCNDKEGLRKIAESIGISPRSYIYYGGWSRQELRELITDKVLPLVIIEAAFAISFDREKLRTLLAVYFFDERQEWQRALMLRETAVGLAQLRFD